LIIKQGCLDFEMRRFGVESKQTDWGVSNWKKL